MKTLVTGCAGFIGFHTTQRLLSRSNEVVGIDILNDYYDVDLEHERLAQLKNKAKSRFVKLDITDRFCSERRINGTVPSHAQENAFS
jgi:UDP-glucuronate 4-epimerase